MLVKEKTRQEIEGKLAQMGDYVRIDYLSSCLKTKIDFDTRKFVLVKLAGLYESSKMFTNAAEAMKSAAEINTTIQNKINDFMKAVHLFIRGGSYDSAEMCARLALSYANERQKAEINNMIKEFYKTQARSFLNEDKRKNAVAAYERLLELKLEQNEKEEFTKKLVELYENLGKMREYYALKRQIK